MIYHLSFSDSLSMIFSRPIHVTANGNISVFLWLILRSLNHFEFILVCGVRECSTFIDLHEAVQLSHHHLLKTLSFLHCIFLILS